MSTAAAITSGMRYGHWLVQSINGRSAVYRCMQVRVLAVEALLAGITTSCGCAPFTEEQRYTGRDVAGARDRERNDLPYWAARRGGEMVASGVLAADAAVTELAQAESRAGLSCSEAERTAWSRIRATGGLAHA